MVMLKNVKNNLYKEDFLLVRKIPLIQQSLTARPHKLVILQAWNICSIIQTHLAVFLEKVCMGIGCNYCKQTELGQVQKTLLHKCSSKQNLLCGAWAMANDSVTSASLSRIEFILFIYF